MNHQKALNKILSHCRGGKRNADGTITFRITTCCPAMIITCRLLNEKDPLADPNRYEIISCKGINE